MRRDLGHPVLPWMIPVAIALHDPPHEKAKPKVPDVGVVLVTW